LAGVIVALLSVNDSVFNALAKINLEPVLAGSIGEGGYQLLGALFFALMGIVLYRTAMKR
jgi:hypothetical protein